MEAGVAVPPVWAEEGAAALLALLHRTVLVICELSLRAHVLTAALKTKDAALAVVTGEERRAGYAQERLERRKKENRKWFFGTGVNQDVRQLN